MLRTLFAAILPSRCLQALCLCSTLASSTAAAALPECKPSRECALERAQWLTLQQLTPASARRASVPVYSPAAVQLLKTLVVRDSREYRSGFTRQVLERAASVGQREVLLRDLARSLIAQQQDAAALPVIIDIVSIAERDLLYGAMARAQARAARIELAYWTASHMRAEASRDAVLLFIAERQLQAGATIGAGQTAAILERERPELQEEALQIQALAAARLDDGPRALQLASGLSTPATFAAAMHAIVEVQIQRNARVDALSSLRFELEQLRRRNAPDYATSEIAERLSLLGASTESLQLVKGSEAAQAQALAAIARGAARAGRFAEAQATLERVPAAQRAAVRSAAAFLAQQRIVLGGVDVASAFADANRFSPLPAKERSSWIRDTAQQLVRLRYLAQARDALNYEVDNVLQAPDCTDDCPRAAPPDTSKPCDPETRDGALCALTALQARFGFLEDADRTANQLRSEHALIRMSLVVARAQGTAGRGSIARRTFARSLALARLAPNNDYLNDAIKDYASWVATAPLHYAAFSEIDSATQELLRLDRNAACRNDGAPLAVVTAHAKAGQFAAAFAMTQSQLLCQQLDAYVRIYEQGMR